MNQHDAESLLADLAAGERASTFGERPCTACEAIEGAADDVREALERALAGTIGEEKLARILSKNGLDVGRRAIARHRKERHTS